MENRQIGKIFMTFYKRYKHHGLYGFQLDRILHLLHVHLKVNYFQPWFNFYGNCHVGSQLNDIPRCPFACYQKIHCFG